MAAPFNYQIFNDVTDKETFLSNIRNVAQNNGWIIDKDDISNNSELYLHSNGNGNQNLYFSMKVDYYYASDYIFIQGNTGFDTNSTWDNQPGKFTSPVLNGDSRATLPYLWFPIQKQYVIVNGQMVIVFCDMISASSVLNGRVIGHLGFGSIDNYDLSNTEGNLVIAHEISYDYAYWTGTGGKSAGGYSSNILGAKLFNAYNTASKDFGLLYLSENKFNTDLGITAYVYNAHNGSYGGADRTYYYGQKGYHYNYAIRFNDWASRTSLIKPIVSIKNTTSTDVYFYPIGELPYYACKAYPYSKAGDIITQGTRKFMIFPLFSYTYGNGVAIEVNV